MPLGSSSQLTLGWPTWLALVKGLSGATVPAEVWKVLVRQGGAPQFLSLYVDKLRLAFWSMPAHGGSPRVPAENPDMSARPF